MPSPLAPVGATKFCMMPELFVTPTPRRMYAAPGTPVMVNALAPALKVIPFNVTKTEVVESFTVVCVEMPNDAVSFEFCGTVFGDQLLTLNHSLETGVADQVA